VRVSEVCSLQWGNFRMTLSKVGKKLVLGIFASIGLCALVIGLLSWYASRAARSFGSELNRAANQFVTVGPGLRASIGQNGESRDLIETAAHEEVIIAVQVTAYRVRNGTLPSDIAQVNLKDSSWNTAWPFNREITVDPWCNPYLLRAGQGEKFFIVSGGLSKKIDIAPADEAALEKLAVGSTDLVRGMIIHAGGLSDDSKIKE
jgi:hypothetical protein